MMDSHREPSPSRDRQQPPLTSFHGAHSIRVLSEERTRKCLLMKLPPTASGGGDKLLTSKEEAAAAAAEVSDRQAVVILEPNPLENLDDGGVFSGSTALSLVTANDVYGTYHARLPLARAHAVATVICPATAEHVRKYERRGRLRVVRESPRDYRELTAPALERQHDLGWLHALLEGRAERERVLYSDAHPTRGHVIAVDPKWEDAKTRERLYCQAIPRRRDLKSIRDLTGDHVTLLEDMRRNALRVFKERFDVAADELVAFFHYRPSFFHLHVHFRHVRRGDACGSGGGAVLREHLLDDVIDNLKLSSGYYREKTLSFVVAEGDPLWSAFEGK